MNENDIITKRDAIDALYNTGIEMTEAEMKGFEEAIMNIPARVK